ncbi:MAG TPA: hypothetical protein PKY50_16660 [Candidatus Competibacter sp.]|nr:hypothetical protein [Candidatus Competibacter sp.]
MNFTDDELDAIVDDLFGDFFLLDENADCARGGGPPREPRISAGLWQARRWDAIIRRLQQWGVRPETIGTEQPQVIAKVPPVIHRRRGGVPQPKRLTTAPNQPDIQAVDPRSGRPIAIEVDRDPQELERKKRIVTKVNPDARAAFELMNALTGQPIETHVWDPLKRRFSVHDGGVRQRDVLDFEWV